MIRDHAPSTPTESPPPTRAGLRWACLWLLAALGPTGCTNELAPEDEDEDELLIELRSGSQIVLPIEVWPMTASDFGGPFYSRDVELDLGGASVATLRSEGKLYLQGHGLGYRDGHLVGPGRTLVKDGKASVWLGSDQLAEAECPWVDLVNPTAGSGAGIEIAEPEVYYGGIGGGFRTVRLTIDLAQFDRLDGTGSCLSSGVNTLRFRFNGTDGVSSGYRILALDVLDGSGGSVLPAGLFDDDDPDPWPVPDPTSEDDVAAGEVLFTTRGILKTRPGGDTMAAACSDCHAEDGRDLEYFAYSNESIVNRAIFHGLDEIHGQRIAAYVRSHDAPRLGRPWNPPYQPGPGLDDGDGDGLPSVEYWAAGAGLDAVLDHELDQGEVMLQQLLGTTAPTRATIADTIRGVGLPKQTINMRELPVAIQLPDWNSWLPEVHPLDIWGEQYWMGDQAGSDVFDTRALHVGNVGTTPRVLATGSFNGDGALDLVVGSLSNGEVSVLLGEYDDSLLHFHETWSADASLLGPGPSLRPIEVVAADFDDDGDDDLALTDYSGSGVWILEASDDGAGGVDFSVSQQITLMGPGRIVAGDFDRNGTIDLAFAVEPSLEVVVLMGSGNGTFGAPQTVPTVIPDHLATGDFDGDGALELVVVASSSGAAQVLDPDTVPLAPQSFSPGAGVVDVVPMPLAGGLDGIVTLHDSGMLRLFARNPSTGGYVQLTQVPTATDAVALAVGDFRDFGLPDIAVANEDSDTIDVFTFSNDTAPTFQQALTLAAGARPGDLVAGDFDEHGGDDLAVVNRDDGTVTLLAAWAVEPEQVYEDVASALPSAGPDEIVELLGRMYQSTGGFLSTGMWRTPSLGSLFGYRGDRSLTLDRAVYRGYDHEFAKRNLAQWVAVKLWQMIQDNDLETIGPDPAIYGTEGEVHSWPVNTWTVHGVAPHLMAVNSDNFRHPLDYEPEKQDADACFGQWGVAPCDPDALVTAAQYHLKGDYDSTAWYHLQLVVQAGSRAINHDLPASPVDVGYAYKHIDDLGRYVMQPHPWDELMSGGFIKANTNGPWEGLRYLATMIKVYQMRNNDKGPVQTGWAMRDVAPRLWVGRSEGDADDDQLWDRLDDYRVGLRVDATDALMEVFLEVVGGAIFAADDWPRCGGELVAADAQGACEPPTVSTVRQTWAAVDPANYGVRIKESMVTRFPYFPAPMVLLAEPGPHEFGGTGGSFLHSADDTYRAIPYLIEMGADPTSICNLIAWGERMWPGPGWVQGAALSTGANPWNVLRNQVTNCTAGP